MKNSDHPTEFPIEGTLDLHTFHPGDVKSLVPEYLRECQKKGITEVRIIHGKGTGTLRRIVHSLLDKSPIVESYALAQGIEGSWGATNVTLKSN